MQQSEEDNFFLLSVSLSTEMPHPDILQHFNSVPGLWYQNSSTLRHGDDGSKGRGEIKVLYDQTQLLLSDTKAIKKPLQTGVSSTKKRLQSNKNCNTFGVMAESKWFGLAGTLKGHLVQPPWPEMFPVMGHPGPVFYSPYHKIKFFIITILHLIFF